MSYQAQTWVDKVGIHQCKNGGELLVLIRVANHTSGSEMRGCYASAETIAGECLMGESTVLKHLRRLKAGGVLLPGDPGLVSHIRADRRPPVYDLAGGHEPGCPGKHSIDLVCRPVATGARSEHPSKGAPATGARFEHPQKKPRSAGARSEHPSKGAPATGVQIDLSRVFKSSTDSYKDLNSLFSVPAGAFVSQPSQPSQEDEREAAAPKDKPTPAAGAGGVPGPRVDTDGSSGDGPAAGVSAAAESVVSAYVDAHVAAVGVQPRPYAVQRVRTDAAALLAAGRDAVILERLAAEMPSHGWTDLVQHLAKNQPKGGSGQGGGGRERCADHPARYRVGCLDCAMAVPV
ncbi:helix-turn-helix domain-containing protein [Streptomyces sp. MT29]|nr:helix-turn-helix domain-containing protein [Streptomyces sp. MT29]